MKELNPEVLFFDFDGTLRKKGGVDPILGKLAKEHKDIQVIIIIIIIIIVLIIIVDKHIIYFSFPFFFLTWLFLFLGCYEK